MCKSCCDKPKKSRYRPLNRVICIPSQQLKHPDYRVIDLVFPSPCFAGQEIDEKLVLNASKENTNSLAETNEVTLNLLNLLTTTSESLNTRRAAVNAYFVALCSAMLTVFASIFNSAVGKNVTIFGLTGRSVTLASIAILGLILAMVWRKTIEEYRLLSRSKIEIVMALESRLEVRPFTAQYDIVEENNYRGITHHEESLANAAMSLFAVLSLVSFVIPLLK